MTTLGVPDAKIILCCGFCSQTQAGPNTDTINDLHVPGGTFTQKF